MLYSESWQRRLSRVWLGRVLRLTAIFVALLPVQVSEQLAQAATAEEAAMEAVCGRCHSLQLVTDRVRPVQQWVAIFEKMVRLGADGTEEQFAAVGRHILTKLTQVRINEAPIDELALLLDVPDSIAAAIVARRERQKFRDLADLASVPGLEAAEISDWKDRIVF